ncbi:unnamed protein product (macronuclear) [Paramecium tetraurelia]|uniref:Uncharacterized protein n=1 Tax=Paramecium tetraurelia TaxID=5888 RepID=A0DYW7_PARTE|nr:uncharacterized protein GSPATT00003202001 [Paramecium tetraurelia]CAK88234.1 unnamed protein product [Paramecium tetraurelia]|eukprot:XP_001455631.1 hypothetical protein (macronuclear) [Paramecium tetraurelia strain d4-2]
MNSQAKSQYQINKNMFGSQIQHKFPNYEDKNLFSQNFFRKNADLPENQNFQQFFYLNNLLQTKKKQMNRKEYQNELNSTQNKCISIQERIIDYIIEYQQQENSRKKYTYIKRKTDEPRMFTTQLTKEQTSQSVSTDCSYDNEVYEKLIEKNFVDYLKFGFENFHQGEFSQILLQNNLISPDRIIIYLNKAINEFNYQQDCKRKENLKVTYVGITSQFNFEPINQEKDFQSLQSFSLMIQNQYSQSGFQTGINDQIKQNQYYAKLNVSNKITNQIHLLFKYFLKTKIRQFKPKIIVLFIEIHDSIDFETYFFQKLITQLEKISQNSLIIIPILAQDTPYNYEKYLKYTVLITNSCLEYSYKRKNKAYYECEDMSPQLYREYSYYFAQNKKEQQFFANQFSALQVRKNKYQSCDIEMEFQQKNEVLDYKISSQQEQEIKSKNYEFEFNVIGILNLINQIVLTKVYDEKKRPIKISEYEHFISYNSNEHYFIICIVSDSKLFYKKCYYNLKSEKQIEEQIDLNEYQFFIKHNFKSSYLLVNSQFYQFNVLISTESSSRHKMSKNSYTGFQYYVEVYKYDLEVQAKPLKYCNKEISKQNIFSLINFSITQLNQNKFILLGGSYQSTCQENNFDLRTCSLTIEIDEKNYFNLKVTENAGKLKCYENSIVVNINNYSLLFFEAQTQYLATPIQSQIQRLSIFGDSSILILQNCQILNQQNFEFYQKKKKLFKSNQLNRKIIQQSNDKLVFIVIVQELVQDDLQIQNQEDSINLKMLSKQALLQVHKFLFIYDLIRTTIDIEVETNQFIIQQVEQPNKLRESCLYVNWLEDRNNQYIFNYNSVQNLYLLYFHEKPSPKTRKFIFEDPKEKDDYLDFDEVILNDFYNEQLWIVRKIIHQDHISLNLYESDWINLQDVKDSLEASVTKVPITLIYTIASIKEDFCLIGLEVKWQYEGEKKCPYLVVCTSTTIYEFSIQMIRKIKWDNILRYKPNSWEKEPLLFSQSPIKKTTPVQFNMNMQIPSIVASLENGELLVFYSYCNVKKEKENKYQLEIQYLILRNLNQSDNDSMELEDKTKEFQFKTIKYNSKKEVSIAKINTVMIDKNRFEFSVIVQETDQNLYKVFSGDASNKNEHITTMKECKILNNAAPQRNQCILVGPNKESVYRLQ